MMQLLTKEQMRYKPWIRAPIATKITEAWKEPELKHDVDPMYQGMERDNPEVRKTLFANFREAKVLKKTLDDYDTNCRRELKNIRHYQKKTAKTYRRFQEIKKSPRLSATLSEPPEKFTYGETKSSTDLTKRRCKTAHPIRRKSSSIGIGRSKSASIVRFAKHTDDSDDDDLNSSSQISKDHLWSSKPMSFRVIDPPINVSSIKNKIIDLDKYETKTRRSSSVAEHSVSPKSSSVFITQLEKPQRAVSARPTWSPFDKPQDSGLDGSDTDEELFRTSSYYRRKKSLKLEKYISKELAILYRKMNIRV